MEMKKDNSGSVGRIVQQGNSVELFWDGKIQGQGIALVVGPDKVTVGFADGQTWEYAREKVRIAGFVWPCNSHEPRPGDNDKHEEKGNDKA
jgi:hypothetical protein